MGPFDVKQGPVKFERSFQSVPKAPTPKLSGIGGIGVPPNGLLYLGVVTMLGACSLAVIKGKKSERVKNAKLLAGAGALAYFIIVPSA
jgi:hypothetical protein